VWVQFAHFKEEKWLDFNVFGTLTDKVRRKGTDVAIMLCTKSEEIYNQMKETVETIENVY